MLFAGQSLRPVPLKPFVFKTRDGYLLGLAMDPQKGAPCAGCVEKWMQARNVWVERAELSDLKLRRDLLGDLVEENSAHTYYEISQDGMATRLDCHVFPHPECVCHRANYIAPREMSKKTNFAFSPIFQLKCARFGTPDGNLWLSSALGDSPQSGKRITAYGVGREKEESRRLAVDNWMKKAIVADSADSYSEPCKAEIIQTGARQLLPVGAMNGPQLIGAGATREEASLSALFQMARVRTLKKYASTMKNPMLIVGANNWVRTRVPFFLLQQYDLHLLFYPNSTPAWVVGIAAFSRIRSDEKPIFVFGSEAGMQAALDMAIGRILEICHPTDDGEMPEFESTGKLDGSKLNLWWTHWIYRCPKISLKDVLHLEAYPRTLDHWRDFLRDGEEPIGIVERNHSLFPSGLRFLVQLHAPAEAKARAGNVKGIGTWSNFSEALL